MKIFKRLKKSFSRESDADILENPSYCVRMKFMLITLRTNYKSKYYELIASRYHKKSLLKQERFINELAIRSKVPSDYDEAEMRKEFIKDFPKLKKLVKKNQAQLVET